MNNLRRCRVCHANAAREFLVVEGQTYLRCAECAATLLAEAHLPDPQTERDAYILHENHPADEGYRRFLRRLADPLLERLAQGSIGLDFGCGPGPTLDKLLRDAGHTVGLYDPFFHPEMAALQQKYDFITCSEVVEHFHHPQEEFARLDGMLKPGGWLGIMTCFQTDDACFAQWNYRRDPTHVVFYQERTFRYLARLFDWSCEIPARNVVLMRKPQ